MGNLGWVPLLEHGRNPTYYHSFLTITSIKPTLGPSWWSHPIQQKSDKTTHVHEDLKLPDPLVHWRLLPHLFFLCRIIPQLGRITVWGSQLFGPLFFFFIIITWHMEKRKKIWYIFYLLPFLCIWSVTQLVIFSYTWLILHIFFS